MKLKLLLASIFLLISFVAYQKYSEYSTLKSIDSYDSCATAKGSVIQESSPHSCVSKLGSIYTETQVMPSPTTPSQISELNYFQVVANSEPTILTNNDNNLSTLNWDEIEFSYPSEITCKCDDGGIWDEHNNTFDPTIYLYFPNSNFIYIQKFENINHLNKTIPLLQNVSKEKYTIDSTNGHTLYKTNLLPSGPMGSYNAIITKDDVTFINIGIVPDPTISNSKEARQQLQTFNQILSTFKFTN